MEERRTLTVIVPVYNEHYECVQETLRRVTSSLGLCPHFDANIIVVDDGCKPHYEISKVQLPPNAILLKHEVNKGYGAALKTGIRQSLAEFIAITDADGTYPIEDLPRLLEEAPKFDMITGIRTGEVSQIPLIRKFPKYILNLSASYFAGRRIRDLNSGFRVFRRSLPERFWGLIPDGFSFTSTVTMAAYLGGYRVKEIPINYFKREGQSSISPIKDTIRFFRLVFRLGLLFSPKRLFTPIAALLFIAGLIKGYFRDYILLGSVGNFSFALMLSGLQIFMMGLIAHLIVLNRSVGLSKSENVDGSVL